MANAALAASVAMFGLIVGSFLNVVIHRVPRNESIVRPRSRCPGCHAEISPRDNIPVLSWVLLRGKCRNCDEAIASRYPATELATAVLFALGALRFGLTVELAAFVVLFCALVVVTAIDLEHRLVPKRIVWPTYAIGGVLLIAAALAASQPRRIVDMAAGSAMAFSVLFLIHFISPRGMGFGDVRLSALLGLFLGWLGLWHVGLGLFAGFVAGGIAGVVALMLGQSRKSAVPFAPFLAVGTVVAVLLGEPILRWYVGVG